MTTVQNAAAARTPMGADLKAGLDTLSLNQTITFTLYRRVVLPLDGYVFWVRAAEPAYSAVPNTSPLNTFTLNQPLLDAVAAPEIRVMGSLHYATDQRQTEDATYAVNRVIFTAQERVTDFNRTSPDELYLGTFDGIRFAFSARGRYYQQAGLHHYTGEAVYSYMESQIVEDPRLLDGQALIVSNSLPAWLALNSYTAPYPIPLPRAPFLLYPSFLSPQNLEPPYGTVHIPPDGTEGLGAGPLVNSVSSQYSYAKERVSVTLYGCSNAVAGSFLLNVLEYAADTARFGIMNIPVIRDGKKTQNELTALAMEKIIDFEVNYYQNVVRDVARQMIEEASVAVAATDLPLAPAPAA